MNEKLTILRDFTEETIINKSRFICTLKKVQTEEEAQSFIKAMKKEYWDATHNCSAYIVNGLVVAERSNDDGEPAGTAGLPMLEVLRKNKVGNVAAVVTRYFGGIKLGAGGLVRAYTGSVSTALKNAGLAKIVQKGIYSFSWSMGDAGQVLNSLYKSDIFKVETVDYGEKATIKLMLLAEDKAKAEAWLTETLSKKIELEEEKIIMAEVALKEE